MNNIIIVSGGQKVWIHL